LRVPFPSHRRFDLPARRRGRVPGLVLNRAAGKKVGDAIVADLPESLKEQPLYLGGPVQPSLLSTCTPNQLLFNREMSCRI